MFTLESKASLLIGVLLSKNSKLFKVVSDSFADEEKGLDKNGGNASKQKL